MRGLTLMLSALYLLYTALNVNSKLEKANLIKGVFMLLSWLSFILALILCCIGM